MFKQVLGICLIFALYGFQSTDAIKCYQCRSLYDANCAKDKIDSASGIRQVDCDTVRAPNTNEQYSTVTKCNKVVGKDSAGLIVTRDCHFEIVGHKQDQCIAPNGGEVVSCFTCKGDLCNASSAGRFVAFGFAVIVAIVAVLQFLH